MAKKRGLLFVLPWPPSINHYYGPRKGGGVRLLPAGRQYRWRVREYLAGKKFEPFDKDDRLCVQLFVHPPDRRKRDLDNIQKAILDALQRGGVYPDDCQIDLLFVARSALKDSTGEINVQISTIGGPDGED